ncbi:MAG: hypothetical protein FJ405_15910 [Verrucomicrobia bacterium]|nr:hypothetical protein [Verrucomicrobiota bacterium]
MSRSSTRLSSRPWQALSTPLATTALIALALVLGSALGFADGPADNELSKVRRQPPPGKPLADSDRQELERGAKELGEEIQSLQIDLSKQPLLLRLLPDVQVFHKAVDWALRYDEFFNPTNETITARECIQTGLLRARELREGKASWLSATGLVVRGYRSRIDGSVQPYGLVVPATYRHGSGHMHRLDLWFHGRAELLTELAFIRDRLRSPGEFTPPGAFVLHPYSRYCNGQKLAGETDAFEALEHVQSQYPVDEDRILVRGFSLGGAACWHLAVHHASRWAGAAPGAGFSETPDFLKVFQNETLKPSWFEQKLWHLYDCPDYALNLFHCPTVAYSGEKDRQKQAADLMDKAMAREGLNLVHVIGADAGHQYTPEARAEINRRMDSIAAVGRQRVPRNIRFATWTLKYPAMAWVTVESLGEHWLEARVEADIVGDSRIRLRSRNVDVLRLNFEAGEAPFSLLDHVSVEVEGQTLVGPKPGSDRSWSCRLVKTPREWIIDGTPASGLRKSHNLQGPIDDAFMDSFLIVKPSGPSWNEAVGKWASAEADRAITHWRRHFRGDARTKQASEVTGADIKDHHLVLWGDPSSNPLIEKILGKLPLRWTRETVAMGSDSFDAGKTVPVVIYPNPLNPKRYVVLNSGFTFREYDYLNNARQVPKLPDWALLDITSPPNARQAGTPVVAGFFDEQWRHKASTGQGEIR